MKTKITNIIVHCSDSSFGNANMIRSWHKSRGWRDVGYHFVVLNGFIRKNFKLDSLNGSIECGRPIDGDLFLDSKEIGAHALGYNRNSIGICLIGKGVFTAEQFDSLIYFLEDLIEKFDVSIDNILGHNETENSNGKTCPNFDMQSIRDCLIQKRY